MKLTLYITSMISLILGVFGLSQLYLVRRQVDIMREQSGDSNISVTATNISVSQADFYIFSSFIGLIGLLAAYLYVLHKPPTSKFIMSVILILAALYSLGLMILSVNHFFLNP